MWKKLVAVMCTAALLVAVAVPVALAADQPPLLWAEPMYAEARTVDPSVTSNALYAPAKTFTVYPFESAQTYTWYGQLSDFEKEIFNDFRDADFGTTSLSYTDFYWPGDFDIGRLLDAITRDMPELFYFNDIATGGIGYYDLNRSGTLDEGDEVVDFTIYTNLNTAAYSSKSAIQSYNTQLWNKINAFNASAYHTRYALIKGIHDFIANSCEYDPNYNNSNINPRAHDAVGCLVDGLCVCQGYSETFQIFCNYLKIPAVCITGTANGGGHMWNGVLMDDGKWYNMDITWDDQGSIYYDFFLVGLNTKDTYFGGSAFKVSHVPDSDNLSVPFTTAKFTQTTANTRFAATYNSAEFASDRVLKRLVTDADEPIYFNGLWLSNCTAAATGDTFTAPSGSSYANQTWTLCLAGDANGDGDCTEEDFSEVVNMALEGSAVNNALSMAADINGDGVLDALDARLAMRFYLDVDAGRDISYAITA